MEEDHEYASDEESDYDQFEAFESSESFHDEEGKSCDLSSQDHYSAVPQTEEEKTHQPNTNDIISQTMKQLA